MRRRALIVFRPALLFMRARKPCFLRLTPDLRILTFIGTLYFRWVEAREICTLATDLGRALLESEI